MDARRFDDLARFASSGASRRAVVMAVAAALAALLPLGPGNDTAAKKKGRGNKKRKKKPPPKTGGPRSCALQPYNADTVAERGLPGDAASNIDFRDIPPTAGRPHYDRVDVEFFTALSFINACAKSHGVTVRPYSAYRTPERTGELGGVKGSAHRAGHAIDMKAVHGGGVCEWTECQHTGCLGTDPPRFDTKQWRYEDAQGKPLDPLHWSDGQGGHGVEVQAVRDFIDCVRNAPSLYGRARKLRWGGDFFPYNEKTGCKNAKGEAIYKGFDPVHFDDGLNTGSKEPGFQLWAKRRDAVDEAAKFLEATGEDCPDDQSCNLRSGKCECDDQTSTACGDECCKPPCESCTADGCKNSCHCGDDLGPHEVCKPLVLDCCARVDAQQYCSCKRECCADACPTMAPQCIYDCWQALGEEEGPGNKCVIRCHDSARGLPPGTIGDPCFQLGSCPPCISGGCRVFCQCPSARLCIPGVFYTRMDEDGTVIEEGLAETGMYYCREGVFANQCEFGYNNLAT